jgi:hypothetical protein
MADRIAVEGDIGLKSLNNWNGLSMAAERKKRVLKPISIAAPPAD